MKRVIDILKQRWLPVIVGTLVYCLFFQALYNLLKYGAVMPGGDIRMFAISYAYNLLPILFIGLLCIFVVAVLPGYFRSWRPKTLVKMLVDFALSAIIFFTVSELFLIIGGLFKPGIKVDWVGAGLNAILVYLIVEVAFYIHATKKSMYKAQEQQRKAMQYQYELLKAQVNPHFLFNSLNILYSLISIDPAKSREFTLRLSSLYRYVLLWQNRDTVPIEEEVEFLKSYISILEMRYVDQLTVKITGEGKGRGRMIVPHTLQILVENVPKHNVISTRQPMTVTVAFGDKGITVSNPLKPKETASPSTEIGIKYIQELYNNFRAAVTVNRNDDVFSITVPYL